MLLRLASPPRAMLLLILAVGCSGHAAHPDGAPLPRDASSIRFIGREEILASRAGNAEDLLQRVRPAFLLPRALRGRGALTYATPVVYVNDVRHGGLDLLRLVPVSSIAEIIYLPPVDADNTLAGLHPAGAILIRTRAGLPQ